jgi:hypothetical protein
VIVRGEPRLAEVAEKLADDRDVEAVIGYTFDTPARPTMLWNDVIGPMFERYGARQPDLEWNPELAHEIVTDWRASLRSNHVRRRTIAPLHNISSLLPFVAVGSDTVIRPVSHHDREEIWRHFGSGSIPGLTPTRLADWTHVIEDHWTMSLKPPANFEVAVDRINNVVTALRLHHPGVTGTTMLWSRVDPPDAFVPGMAGQPTLLAPEGTPTFADSLRTDIAPTDGPALTTLVERLIAARTDRRVALALRRFNSAYGRHDLEDSLIDLWVAFEALLTPDSTQELSYRAALRIGRLGGATAADREKAFKLARRSYNARSEVVHGEPVKGDLDKIVRDTRQLARVVLRAWVLEPPDDVHDLDRAMLA